jgi:hypothetical protein
MTNPDLSIMPTPDLLREFTEIAIQQSYAEAKGEQKKLNKLMFLRFDVVKELKARNCRDRLAVLFDHPVPWVRMQAASSAYNAIPEQARPVLESLCARKLQPEAGWSGMTLAAHDKGWAVKD